MDASLKDKFFKKIVVFIFKLLFDSIFIEVKECHADLQICSKYELYQFLSLYCFAQIFQRIARCKIFCCLKLNVQVLRCLPEA
jgi:hypothetical protein